MNWWLRPLSTFVLVLVASPLLAGIGQVKVMPRVDQSDLRVRVVLAAWVDSLSTWRGVVPASAGFDRSAVPGSPRGVVVDWFSQSEDIVREFPPTILSIEPEQQNWVVRTMFSTVDPDSRHVIPLGILRTTFRFDEDGLVETVQPLPAATSGWLSEQVGRLQVRYSSKTQLDRSRAAEAVAFLERTAGYFAVPAPEHVTMYVAADRDEMCSLFGLEYYAFPPSGMAFPDHGMVFSGLGDVYHPHELSHLVIDAIAPEAHEIINEGVATWLGGSITADFTTLVADYLRGRSPETIPNYLQLFTDREISQDDQYVLGAVIIDAIHRRHGAAGVRQALTTTSTSGVMLAVTRMLAIEQDDRIESLLPLINEALAYRTAQPGR